MYTIEDIDDFLKLNEKLTALYQKAISEIDASKKSDRYSYEGHKAFLIQSLNYLTVATTELKKIHITRLEEKIERLEAICACAYQMAGVYDAPVRFLDALAFHDEYMQMTTDEIMDALLPVGPVEDEKG